MCGYTSSIVCKIFFEIFLPKPYMEYIVLKKTKWNIFTENLTGTKNCDIYVNPSNTQCGTEEILSSPLKYVDVINLIRYTKNWHVKLNILLCH